MSATGTFFSVIFHVHTCLKRKTTIKSANQKILTCLSPLEPERKQKFTEVLLHWFWLTWSEIRCIEQSSCFRKAVGFLSQLQFLMSRLPEFLKRKIVSEKSEFCFKNIFWEWKSVEWTYRIAVAKNRAYPCSSSCAPSRHTLCWLLSLLARHN